MYTAILILCAGFIAGSPDVLDEHEAWAFANPFQQNDPTMRRQWIDRFLAADQNPLPPRALDRLGDLYVANGNHAEALDAYRQVCIAGNWQGIHELVQFAYAARDAGVPNDAAYALQMMHLAGGTADLGGIAGEMELMTLSQFLDAAPTLVLDARIQEYHNGAPLSAELANVALGRG